MFSLHIPFYSHVKTHSQGQKHPKSYFRSLHLKTNDLKIILMKSGIRLIQDLNCLTRNFLGKLFLQSSNFHIHRPKSWKCNLLVWVHAVCLNFNLLIHEQARECMFKCITTVQKTKFVLTHFMTLVSFFTPWSLKNCL